MMNRPARSAMCAPSMFQSAVVERPSTGTQKPAIGATVSIATAIPQSVIRSGPSDSAPASQSGASAMCQIEMRTKLRWLPASWLCSAHSMNMSRNAIMAM